MRLTRRALVAPGALVAALLVVPATPAAAVETCLGQNATIVIASPGQTTLGSSGADVIVGTAGNDTVFGLEGNDVLCGRGGNDTLWGGGGVNTFDPGPGDDAVWGNSTDLADVLTYESSAGPVTVDLGTATATGDGTDDINYIRKLRGSSFADLISGDGDPETFWGGPGFDIVNGNGGADWIEGGDDGDILRGGDDADTLRGQAGDDTLDGQGGNDSVWGQAGDDAVYSSPGDDELVADDQECHDGGQGGGGMVCSFLPGTPSDMLFMALAPGPVTVDLAAQTASGDGTDGAFGFHVVVGTDGNDTLLGSQSGDYLRAGDGDDHVDGRGGDDWFQPGAGDDDVVGGDGTDTLDYSDVTTRVTVDLAQLRADGAGADVLSSVEDAVGSPLKDVLKGTSGPNTLWGGGGKDRVDGRGGPDQLLGEGGGDTVTGGHGDDLVDGGDGVDTAAYAGAPGPVTADLAAGAASGDGTDTLVDVERLVGGPRGDTLRGDGADNRLTGGAGQDLLVGLGGADDCRGGPDRDRARTCEKTSSVP